MPPKIAILDFMPVNCPVCGIPSLYKETQIAEKTLLVCTNCGSWLKAIPSTDMMNVLVMIDPPKSIEGHSELVAATESIFLERGTEVRYLFTKDGNELVHVIRFGAKSADLKYQIPDLLNELDNLDSAWYQRKDTSGQINHEYKLLHELGWSYGDIAMEINIDLLALAITIESNKEDQQIIRKAIVFFYSILRSVCMKDENIVKTLDDTKEILKTGKLYWNPTEGPIDYQKVAKSFGLWENAFELLHRNLIYPNQVKALPYIWYFLISEGYHSQALKMYQKEFPKFAKRINKLREKVLNQIKEIYKIN